MGKSHAVVALVTLLLLAGPGSADILFRTFDSQILGQTLGNVDIERILARSAPGALRMEALPGEPVSFSLPIRLDCAAGSTVDVRFLVESDADVTGRIGLIDLLRGATRIASVGMTTADAIDVGLPGSFGYKPAVAPAAGGEWHHLRAQVKGSLMTLSLDGATVGHYSAVNSLPDLLRISISDVESPLRVIIDDVRITPVVNRFFDPFVKNSWFSSYIDPGESKDLVTYNYKSAPSSLRLISVDGDSSFGMGVLHEFALPSCIMPRILTIGASVWFNLPEDQPWGNAAFGLLSMKDTMDYTRDEFLFQIGDSNGDRLLDVIERDGHTILGTIHTGYPIPFGGWHLLDVDVRPADMTIDVGNYPGLLKLPPQDLVAEVRIDGELVGAFPVGTNKVPRYAHLGTVWTRPWLSDDFVSYWDDFKVRVELAAPLCGDSLKIFPQLDPVLPFDSAWLSGDTGIERLVIDPGTGPIDVTSTRETLVDWVGDGAKSILYSIETTQGFEIRETCSALVDTVPPTVSHSASRSARNGWYPGDTLARVTARDVGSGIQSITTTLDADPPVIHAGNAWLTRTVSVPLKEGLNHLEYRASDLAGSGSITRNAVFMVDGQPPRIAADVPEHARLITPLGAQPLGPQFQGDYVAATPVAYEGTASDDMSGIRLVRATLNGKAVPVELDPQGAWRVSVTPARGSQILLVQAEDWAGNTASYSRTIFGIV